MGGKMIGQRTQISRPTAQKGDYAEQVNFMEYTMKKETRNNLPHLLHG